MSAPACQHPHEGCDAGCACACDDCREAREIGEYEAAVSERETLADWENAQGVL